MNTNKLYIDRALQTETDTRAFRSVLMAVFCSLGLSWYLAQHQPIIHDYFFAPAESKQSIVKVKFTENKKVVSKTPAPAKLNKRPTGNGGSGKSTRKGNPKAIRETSVLALITARNHSLNQSAYDLMSKKLHNDVEKTLASHARILTHGNTTFGAKRPGALYGSYNGTVGSGNSGGIEDAIAGLMGTPGALQTRTVGKMAPPRASDIFMPDNAGGRSSQEIMQVVRARTPGLRHIFNKYLKQHADLAGKVTLQFTILAGGEVVECRVVDSTLGDADFADDVRSTVATWKFKVIKTGNTTVTIPFTFSE